MSNWAGRTFPASLAHVEEPVVLADHHLNRRLELIEDLLAEFEFLAPAELSEIATEENEVGLRIERVDILDRFDRRAHEALVERALDIDACPKCMRR